MTKTRSDQKKATEIKGQLNWTLPQVSPLSSTSEYLAIAEKLTPALNRVTHNLVQELSIEVKVGSACVKSQASAIRKLVDATVVGDPKRIRDYLRIKITVPNTGPQSVDDLEVLKEAIKNHPITQGYKDQFAFPEPETGFRSFKAHPLIEDPELSDLPIVAEWLIEHEGMREANSLTASFRAVERKFRDATSGLRGAYKDVAGARISKSESLARNVRKDIHDVAASKAGLNRLISPEANYTCSHDVKSILKKCDGAYHGIKQKVGQALENL